tara:strand:- start:34 stop:438 length:405 start_codon:yes stop_codon:yes gene_type:complete
MKKCSKCKEEKEFSEFYKDKRSPDNLGYTCKVCSKTKNAQYYIDNKTKFKVYNLSKNYGVSQEDFIALLKEQDSRCKICGVNTLEESGKTLHLDHCHDSGKVRGLLCQTCNTGLGHFRDNVSNLKKAIKYLEEV